MDKKTGIIIGIITAVIVILVAVVFVMEGSSNNSTLAADVIAKINGNDYSVTDFKNYIKLSNLEDGDINKKMDEEGIQDMLEHFLQEKIYSEAAKNNGIELESGDVASFSKEYDEKASTLVAANISREDYEKYKTDNRLKQELQMNISKYYELPSGEYETIKENYEKQGMYKTYGYRLMAIPYENPKSGDESGDVSGDVSGDSESGEKEDLSREAQMKVAEDVLARIKSGDDFEKLSKEYGSTRISFKGNSYVLVNGDLEYATMPLLSSKLGSEDLYNAVIKLKNGDVTDIIEDEQYTTLQIVKVESVEDGFTGEGETELKEVLLSQTADGIISAGMKYEVNKRAVLRTMYDN